jgi:hypothetical protein
VAGSSSLAGTEISFRESAGPSQHTGRYEEVFM